MSSSNQRPANRGFRSVFRCAISHYRQSSCLSAPEPPPSRVSQSQQHLTPPKMLAAPSDLRRHGSVIVLALRCCRISDPRLGLFTQSGSFATPAAGTHNCLVTSHSMGTGRPETETAFRLRDRTRPLLHSASVRSGSWAVLIRPCARLPGLPSPPDSLGVRARQRYNPGSIRK